MLGATITVGKHVPAGSGMGGGSSDAATTLIALNRLWGLDWPREKLMALACQLGADVPFFLGPGQRPSSRASASARPRCAGASARPSGPSCLAASSGFDSGNFRSTRN